MKYFSHLIKTALLPLWLLLLMVSFANVAANELKPMNALQTGNHDASINVLPRQETPFLLLAQAANNKAEAAQIAKSRHGGTVLSVRKSGNGWQVKLLLDDGRVKMVYVEGSGPGK